MKFIDLYAGLGGFHVGLAKEGYECVYASEINNELNEIYQKNFGIKPSKDITKVHPEEIPNHDILCAGFPCQPFSKAGKQLGFECEENGKHIFKILEIAKIKKPTFLFLENVPNLLVHNNSKTWNKINREIKRNGYDVKFKILSPHRFGVPHLRERLIIICSRKCLDTFEWPNEQDKETNVSDILENNRGTENKISKNLEFAFEKWQEFTSNYIKHHNNQLANLKIGVPIWGMEFGATYPFSTFTPWASDKKLLQSCKGSLGYDLKKCKTWDEFQQNLPPYSLERKSSFPNWKVRFIDYNRHLYESNKFWIKGWMNWLGDVNHTFQKFEWNFDITKNTIWDCIIQTRSSGIRVRNPSLSPSLVSIGSAFPIIGWQKRFMTRRECVNLQSLSSLKYLPESNTHCLTALGNSINSEVVKHVGIAIKSFSKKTVIDTSDDYLKDLIKEAV